MGFFKNLFGNKSEDDVSSTSQPDSEETGRSTAQPVVKKPAPPPRVPEPRVKSENSNSDSKASQKVSAEAVDKRQPVKAKETNQTAAKTAPPKIVPQRSDGPPSSNNIVQFKSVSVSSAPPAAKQKRITPPAPPKAPPRDNAKRPPTPPSSTRDSEPKVSRSTEQTQSQSTDKKPNGLATQSKEKPFEPPYPRVRAFGKGPRDSLPVSQGTTKVVTAEQPPPKNPGSSAQSLKEKLMASAEVAANSRNGVKPRSGVRVFRTAMMEAKQKSIPPKAPEIDLKSAVEWAFEAAQQSNDTRSKAAKTVLEDAGKQSEIQVIFSELVEKRAKGLRDFALELSLGLTPKKWTAVCRDTVESIGQAANTLKRTELADVLTQFRQQLDEANQQLGPSINPSFIFELNNSYAKLAQQMPDSFGVGNTPSERERLLVETLLLQVSGVGRNVIKQIDSNQTVRYRELCTADASAIAQKVGIDETMANAISEKFISFQKDREAIEPNSRIERAHQKLEELAQQLDSYHRDFCQADDDDDSENKRNARRAQATTSARIDVLLADIAELELLKSLKPLSIQKKIEAIKAFLDQTASQPSQARESSPTSKEVSG